MQRRILEKLTVNRRLVLSSVIWYRYQAMRSLYVASTKRETHYDLLGLRKDCSAGEIKDAFFRLSKELHPDKHPNSPDLHKKFVAVNEAYSILSKPHLRLVYDAELASLDRHPRYTHGGIRTNAPQERVIFRDETLWEMRDRSEDQKYADMPYYPVGKRTKKLPNWSIAAGAVVFMVVGAIFHFYIAKKSSDMAIEQLNRRDQMASMNHMMAREAARLNGNELQMTLLRKRIESESHGK